jgi:hypothetical protein
VSNDYETIYEAARSVVTPKLTYELDGEDNKTRAEWARIVVRTFEALVGPFDMEDMETILSDLYADLRHLADVEGVDWTAVEERGNGHYEEEVREISINPCFVTERATA